MQEKNLTSTARGLCYPYPSTNLLGLKIGICDTVVLHSSVILCDRSPSGQPGYRVHGEILPMLSAAPGIFSEGPLMSSNSQGFFYLCSGTDSTADLKEPLWLLNSSNLRI